MISRFAGWVNVVNTTSFRIVVNVIIMSIGMLMVLVAILFFGWEPKPIQVTVLTGLAAVALTREGFDVTQFIGKRFSDASYAKAKAAPAVQVEAPSIVQVPAGGAEPPPVGSPVDTSSATGAPPVGPRESERGDE